jgi:D-alanyl-D-alanine carboxypeptidase
MTSERIQELVPELDGRIRQKFDGGGVPGLAVGVIAGDGLAWFKGYGARDFDTGEAVNELTLFRIGSVTKTFTATAIMQLRDAGLLGLDDPLLVHMPDFTVVNARQGSLEGVTPRRLMTHYSGLVKEPPNLSWTEPSFPTQEQIVDALADIEVVIPQDFQWKYSNLAYALLGMVIERITGRPYADYLQEEIIDPLGLAYTTLEPTSDLKKHLAIGYSPPRNRTGFRKAPYAALNGMSPCGQLHSNVHDLAKWTAFQFESQLDGKSTVLSTTTLQEMHRPQYLDPGWKSGQGLGWRVQNVDGEIFNLHGGGIHGFATNVVFHRKSRTGVIVLANVWPAMWLDGLTIDLARMVADAMKRAVVSTEGTADPTLAEYVGDYWGEPGVSITLEVQGSVLRISCPAPGEPQYLPAVGMDKEARDKFRVKESMLAGEVVSFSRDTNGHLNGFRLCGFFYERQT